MRALIVAITAVLTAGTAMAAEEPSFELVSEHEGYEVRLYAPYIVAETTVTADFEGSRSQAFRRLFAYISGANTTDDGSVEMEDADRPVAGTARKADNEAGEEAGEPAGKKTNEKIEMTIPVVSNAPADDPGGDAEYTTYFVLPDRYTLETAPRPTDERVRIREVPARTAAVRRYSGRTTESNYRDNERALLGALARDKVEVIGEPASAVYDGPFTPWFMRRNEVIVEIAP